MQVDKFDDLELYQWSFEIERIGNNAISDAKKESKEMGVPLLYSINDQLIYELPDGTITTASPFK